MKKLLIAFLITIAVYSIGFGQQQTRYKYVGKGFTIELLPLLILSSVTVHPVGSIEIYFCPNEDKQFSISINDNQEYKAIDDNTKQIIYAPFKNYQSFFISNPNPITIINTATGLELCRIYFPPVSSGNFRKIRLAGSQIKNDTVVFCKTADSYSYQNISLYTNVSDANPFCTNYLLNNLPGDLIVNEVNYGRFYTKPFKNGDKIKVKVIRNNFAIPYSNFLNDYYSMTLPCRCLKLVDYDTIYSQTITCKIIENEKLSTPIILTGNNGICAGDTATISKNTNLKSILWNYYFTGYDSVNIKKVTKPQGLNTISDAKKTNGCYAVSDTVYVTRKICGPKLLRGVVFEDKIQNNTLDKNERPLQNIKVQIKNSALYTFSDSRGVYTFQTNEFKNYYSINPQVSDNNYFINTQSGYFYPPDTSYLEINIPTYKLLSSDLSLQTQSGRHRPGFTIPLYFNITNQGKLTNGGTLTVTLDNAFTYSSASKAPKTVNGKTLTFDVDSMLSSGSQTITVYATLFSGTALGSTVTTNASLSTTKTDANLSNNTSSIAATVVGSFDPNEIEVKPKGLGTKGYIMDSTKLNYVIRFQNLGTDTAFTVVVKNKLPNGVDFSQFTMKNASHPYQLSMLGDTIVWTFKNIRLPHKAVNEPKSHGLIAYKITQKTKNPAGTEIKNKAGIYFDFNAPVLTNEVLNTVDNGMVTGIYSEDETSNSNLFPNPSDGHFTFQSSENGVLKIYDNVGQLVYTQSHHGNLSLDLSYLPKGLYHFKTEGNTKSAKGKIILK